MKLLDHESEPQTDDHAADLAGEIREMRQSLARIEAKLERPSISRRSSVFWWLALHILAAHYGMTSPGNELVFLTFYFSGLISLVSAIGIVAHSRQQWSLALAAYLGPYMVLHPKIFVASDVWFWVVVLCCAGLGSLSVSRAFGKLRRRCLAAPDEGTEPDTESVNKPVSPRISDLMILTVILAVSFSMIGNSFRSDSLVGLLLTATFGLGMGITWLGYAIWLIPVSDSLGPNRYGTVICLLPLLAYAIVWALTGNMTIAEAVQLNAAIHASCAFTAWTLKRVGYRWCP